MRETWEGSTHTHTHTHTHARSWWIHFFSSFLSSLLNTVTQSGVVCTSFYSFHLRKVIFTKSQTKMNYKQSLLSYVYLRLRGERSHELNRLPSYWLSLPLFICIKSKDSELYRVAGHARYRSCRCKSPALHWNEWDRVALLLVVWMGLYT